MTLTHEELEWIDSVSTELTEFFSKSEWSQESVAAMLDLPVRDLKRAKAGTKEKDLRFNPTNLYAAIFFHCGITSADPRTIPNSRAMTDVEYNMWRRKQSTPLLISHIEINQQFLKTVVKRLQAILEDPYLADALRAADPETVAQLHTLVRLLSLPRDARERELEILNSLKNREER